LFGAVVIGLTFSFSIAGVLPLLKVMMAEEGLHGWVNRKTCEGRYGVSFLVPDRFELTDPNHQATAYNLQISDVKKGGAFDKAGVRQGDFVVGAGARLITGGKPTVPASRLLRDLAAAKTKTNLDVQYQRLDNSGQLTTTSVNVRTGRRPFYADGAELLLSFVPEGQTREARRQAVLLIIVLMMIVTAVRCLASYFQVYAVHSVMNNTMAEVREDAFRHAMDIPVGFFDREGASDTVSRLMGDMTTIGSSVKILLGKTLREPMKAIAALAVAFFIDRNLTLIFLCGAPISMFVITKLGRKIKRVTKKSLVSAGQILGKLKEALSAVRVIKVYNRQEYEDAKFSVINRQYLKQHLRIAKIDATTGPILEMLGMMAGSVGLIFGAYWVYRGQMQASNFFALLVLLGAAAESARKTSDIWNNIQQANAAAERVFGIVDRQPELERADAFELPALREKIEFRDIVFTYPGSNRPVLKGVNLTVDVGHNIAIVGPNGSGKTTLANLIPRFYDPDQGQVLIDGKDIRDATLRSLRSEISMVTQNVVTFNDTIAANIGYGRLDAGPEEIVAAAKRAFAHEFIEPLPNGYNTIIGEQGAGLSGGQLQRIVIARAILKNPAILIFDEATSQVDAESEAKIHKAIEEIMHDRTSFIIAHRFSTVISADVIVVMDDGQIVAQGQHEELIDSCPLYQSLYETQLVGA
jgi:ABC-type multidrug transport system fused ATPase/permease subunit